MLESTMADVIAKHEVSERRKGKPVTARRTGMDKATAERIAADLEGFDAQIVGGRLRT